MPASVRDCRRNLPARGGGADSGPLDRMACAGPYPVGDGTVTEWALYALGATLAVYALVVLAFVVLGRREHARAIAGFVPDCVVLFTRLLRDKRLSRRHKVLVAALIPYLAMPFDLIPDFIPVAGQLDDAVLVAFVLRRVVRSNPDLIRELWPGPSSSLLLILRLVGR
jgi:uncharacterized membrane protein YkvA (DUF1232 family)